MSDDGLMDAFHCLGLKPTSDRILLEQAYRKMKALCSEETLATYGLFDDDERTGLLEEIEAAYGRLNAAEEQLRLPQAPCSVRASEPMPPLDDSTAPATYLRLARENRGMTLQEIARQTKIGTRYLAMIEEESYDALPAPVYLRGFVLDFARTVGVPAPEEVARRYLDRCRETLDGQV
jgi:flagellar biosynthesis protein FlhG